MKKNRYIKMLHLSMFLILLASCDAGYVIRGVVTESVQDSALGRPTANYLQDVVIDLSYIDKTGNVKPVLNDHMHTDKDGKYGSFFRLFRV